MAVTAASIKELRERTGAGMLDCKKALESTDGNIEHAIDWLREKGIAKAAKKAGRIAAEGLVFGGEKGNLGAILEFNSETDFVAKNDDFKNFGEKLVNLVLDNKLSSVEELEAFVVDGKSIKDQLTDLIAVIGENLNLRRVTLLESENGFVVTYIHLGGKVGVVLSVDGEVSPENHDKARGVAMHVAAMDPSYLRREEVTADDLEREKEVQRVKLIEEGKPEAMVEKILEGKMRKFYEENTLLEQKYVRDDSKSVKDFMSPCNVVKFARYKVGEGIEKAETDFAAEVAAQIANTK